MGRHTFSEKNARNESAKRKRRIVAAWQWGLAVVVLIIIVFPIYWMLISSVKSQEKILLTVPTLWPKEFYFENYLNVLRRGNFTRYYFNTAVMTAGILFCQVVTEVFAGYGSSKRKFKGQGLCLIIVLGALVIPLQVTFIPIYIMMANWGVSGFFAGPILPEAMSPYYTLMPRQTFMPIDNSYIEAARMDGSGRIGIITRVLAPMCKSTLFAVTLMTFTNRWNTYFRPKIIAKGEKRRVLTVGLAYLKSTLGGQETMNNHEIMVGAVMAVIPVIILFFIFQKHMLTGYSKTAMK